MPLSDSLSKALVILRKYPHGATCSTIGLEIYPAKTAHCNRAREEGALIRRLCEAGLAERGRIDYYHTLWVAKNR